MRFAIGDTRVDAVIDDDDFELPLMDFLPGIDTRRLIQHRGVLEPDHRALLEEAAETGGLLVPAHFRGRPCTRIRRSAAGFEPILESGNHPVQA